MAQAEHKTFTDVERALIIAALKLQTKSTDRAARSYNDNGKHAMAKALQNEIIELTDLINKVRSM